MSGWSDSRRQKIIQALTGRKRAPFSPEWRANIARANRERRDRKYYFLVNYIQEHQREDPCFIWPFNKLPIGYGRVKNLDGTECLTHRIAYQLTHDDFNPDLQICHSCDNPSCFNPDHLFQGTQHDNMQDAIHKNRLPHGGSHYRARLTEEQVDEIRKSTLSAKELGKKFNYSHSNIIGIRNGRIWKKADQT